MPRAGVPPTRPTQAYHRKKRQVYRNKTRAALKGAKWISSINRQLRVKPNDVYFCLTRRMDSSSLGQLNQSATGEHALFLAGSRSFTITDAHNHSELTALFDYYRIKAVECKFVPFGNVVEQSNPSADSQQALMRIMYKVDNDDVTIPNFSEMKESGVKSHMIPPMGFRIVLKPRPLKLTYEGALGQGYAVSRSDDWLDCDDAIEHFGLKYIVYVPHINTATPQAYPHFQIEYRMVLELKGLL